MNSNQREKRAWFGVALVVALWAYFFLPVLIAPQSFSFRDTATFYRPLYSWIQEQWTAGRVPVWNDRIGIGVPVIADSTSAVFYPGKLVFFLPTPYRWNLNLYVASHVLLAAAGAYRTARDWRRSRFAATLAAMAFAFSGSVLFQHCNIVFLVGAAWLPWSVLFLTRGLSGKRYGFVGWSLTLAMMVLGGDPQMGYHCALLAGLALLCRVGWRPNDTADTDATQLPRRLRWQGERVLQIIVAAGFAGCLAAIQILPSAAWSERSARAARESARSVYDWIEDENSHKARGNLAELFAEPQGRGRQIYAFSVGPWRWSEFVFPNATGKMFPENRRWIRVLPAEGKVWSPSLYLGLPALLFAGLGISLRDSRRRWLTAFTALSLIAAMGWYGLGWIILETRHAATGNLDGDGMLGAPVGGLYWLLVNFLPGYSLFRYPAKWITVTSLGVSLLAAYGWDRCRLDHEQIRRRLRQATWGLAAFSLVTGSGLLIADRPLGDLLNSQVQGESFFGPFDGAAAVRDLRATVLHTALTSLCICYLLRGFRSSQKTHLMLLGVAALELGLANGWMVPLANDSHWAPPTTQTSVEDDENDAPPKRIYRSWAPGWLPNDWTTAPRDDHIADALAWNAKTLYPNLHLLADDVAVVNGFSSIESARWNAWLAVGRQHGVVRGARIRDPHPQTLLPLGITQAWLPETGRWPGGASRVDQHDAENLSVWSIESPWPRAWLVEDAFELEPIDEQDQLALHQRTEDVLFTEPGVWRDLRRQVVVERTTYEYHGIAGGSPPSIDSVQSKFIAPGQIELLVEASARRWLVVNNQYAEGWRCDINTDDALDWSTRIQRANSVMQGVELPPGRHRIMLNYAPTSLRRGAWISGLAWASLFGLAVVQFIRTRWRLAVKK